MLFTTGSGAATPSPDRAASAVYTAAESAYLDVLRTGVEQVGVHVVHLVVAGPVGGAGHQPDVVARALQSLADRGVGRGVLELNPDAGGDVRSTLRYETEQEQP